MQTRHLFSWLIFPLLALFLLAGCHQANLIDSPLFNPGRDNEDHKATLNRPDGVQQTTAVETKAKKANSHPTPVPADSLKRVTVGQVSNGEQKGADALVVALEPRDGTGRIVPVVANVQVVAIQTSVDGKKSILAIWKVTSDQLQDQWDKGSGYLLRLQWKQWPAQEQVRVVAQVTVHGGKTFEADKDVRLHLTARAELPPGVETVSHHNGLPQPGANAVQLLRPVPMRDNE